MDYQKRKAAKDREAVDSLKTEVKALEEDKTEMAKVNKDCHQLAAKYQAEADKNLKRLNARTDRFVSFVEKKEAQITRAKSEAKQTVSVLKSKHEKELNRQRAQQFRKSRAQDKEVAALKDEVGKAKTNAAKDVARAEDKFNERDEAMEWVIPFFYSIFFVMY